MGHEKVVGRRGGGCRVCGEHGRLQSLERGHGASRSLETPSDSPPKPSIFLKNAQPLLGAPCPGTPAPPPRPAPLLA